jgi:hypothetical protein
LDVAKGKVTHPLKDIVFDEAIKMVRGMELSVQEALERMETVKGYVGQYGLRPNTSI